MACFNTGGQSGKQLDSIYRTRSSVLITTRAMGGHFSSPEAEPTGGMFAQR